MTRTIGGARARGVPDVLGEAIASLYARFFFYYQ
jgi:hypothetical protein